MRKIYVKKESLYLKPFYKQKCFFVVLLVVGIVFLGYQLFYVSQLKIDTNLAEFNKVQTESNIARKDESKLVEVPVHKNTIRGIRFRDMELYSQKHHKLFKCISTGVEISFDKINDDYCDCPDDGSDEPGTTACKNGKFFCTYQTRHKTGRGVDVSVPSGRVNDGICDCCDCSDESEKSKVLRRTNTCR